MTATDGLVARLAHRYGPQRVAVTTRDVKQILVGSLIAFAAGWVVVEALVWIVTLP